MEASKDMVKWASSFREDVDPDVSGSHLRPLLRGFRGLGWKVRGSACWALRLMFGSGLAVERFRVHRVRWA